MQATVQIIVKKKDNASSRPIKDLVRAKKLLPTEEDTEMTAKYGKTNYLQTRVEEI